MESDMAKYSFDETHQRTGSEESIRKQHTKLYGESLQKRLLQEQQLQISVSFLIVTDEVVPRRTA